MIIELNSIIKEINVCIKNENIINIAKDDCINYLNDYMKEAPNEFKKKFPTITNTNLVKINLYSILIKSNKIYKKPFISIIFEIENNIAYYESRYSLDYEFLDDYIIEPTNFKSRIENCIYSK
ncbi:hypothetical protein AN639_10820 [Candidatus Epulonipiscium fishelsonii]|uniref:Uncharacterized protein n=1 Tax=Candidatus Epulonipiscium fishelsonii TaxID=77094 RepID=A0ACC8XED7_9FIRM|nr:hypothetical protein AN396_03620 [Epulopiscium sp. SCG-B11WGA-EpuloA1]ONI43224.1 hypothetical protein AN639_10820 [Epulopiscium sp. SCG-B05WGA-EpuloA1]